MGHSQFLSQDSVRSIMRLVREVCELGDDPIAWRQHMLQEMQRLCGAMHVVSGVMPLSMNAARLQFFADVRHGFDNSALRIYDSYLAHKNLMSDPMTLPIMAQFGKSATLARPRIVGDSEWYGSAYYNEIRRPMGCDDTIVALLPVHGRDCTMVLGLTRDKADGHFTERDRALVDLFHEELAYVIQTPSLRSNRPETGLSRRQEQIVTLLGRGKSEKQIAADLMLSPHTVHNYIRTLYRKMSVNSQTELLAATRPQVEFRPRLM